MASLRKSIGAGLALVALTAAAGAVSAQQLPPQTGGYAQPPQAPRQPSSTAGSAPQAQPQPKAKAATPPPAGTPAAAKAATTVPASDGQLRQRVEQLEEQMVDLQVVIGTLESLAKSGGASASASPAFRGGTSVASFQATDVARIDSLETQIRALTSQVEQLSSQLRGQPGRRSEAQPEPQLPPAAMSPRAEPPRTIGRFGSTTVTAADGGDPIGGLLRDSEGTGGRLPPAQEPAGAPERQAFAAPGGDGAGPKQLYETAYGLLLQQDYGAAEAAFEDFLRRYPSDGLAGNAQYWLGETHFVRGQYKQAAASFLKGYQSYGASAKAPDSLLKLAMSLDRLGQKDAACASYSELTTRFPRAPQHVKNRADSERRRIGCA